MWFTETAWPPMVILSVLVAACVWIWSQRRQTRFLIAGILCVAGIVASYLADELIVSDRERITSSIFTMADDFQRRDLKSTLSHISARQDGLQSLVERGFEMMTEIEYLNISDVEVSVFGQGARARSHFRANGRFHAKGYGDVGHQPTRWECSWQKEGHDWKIVNIRRLDPITGEEMGTLSRRQ